MFEDDPSWYMMIKNNPDLKVYLKMDVLILYRIHNKSVSNSKVKNTLFNEELHQLWKKYYYDTKGMEHVFFWFKLHDFLPRFLRLDKWYNLICKLKYKIFAVTHKEYLEVKNNLKKIALAEQKYYQLIKKKTERFMQLYG